MDTIGYHEGDRDLPYCFGLKNPPTMNRIVAWPYRHGNDAMSSETLRIQVCPKKGITLIFLF